MTTSEGENVLQHEEKEERNVIESTENSTTLQRLCNDNNANIQNHRNEMKAEKDERKPKNADPRLLLPVPRRHRQVLLRQPILQCSYKNLKCGAKRKLKNKKGESC